MVRDVEIPFDIDEWNVYIARALSGMYDRKTADDYAQCFTLANNGNWKYLHSSTGFISVSREYIRMGQWQI